MGDLIPQIQFDLHICTILCFFFVSFFSTLTTECRRTRLTRSLSPPQFGDSQQLRLVRILRSTVMVRVGGGWMALDEFLVKNDPCRGEFRSPAPNLYRTFRCFLGHLC